MSVRRRRTRRRSGAAPAARDAGGHRVGRAGPGMAAVEAIDQAGAAPEAALDRVERRHLLPQSDVLSSRDHFELGERKNIIICSFPEPAGRDPDIPRSASVGRLTTYGSSSAVSSSGRSSSTIDFARLGANCGSSETSTRKWCREAKARGIREIHRPGRDQPDFLDRHRAAQVDLDPGRGLRSGMDRRVVSVARAWWPRRSRTGHVGQMLPQCRDVGSRARTTPGWTSHDLISIV